MPTLGIEAPQILIITCIDARTIPEHFLQLKTGEALVLRNVAGYPEPSLKDILLVDSFLGLTDIMVGKHTDCGATHFHDEDIRARLRDRVPERRGEIDGWEFGKIRNSLEEAVRKDLEFLRGSEFIREELKERRWGFIYDMKSGLLNAVEG